MEEDSRLGECVLRHCPAVRSLDLGLVLLVDGRDRLGRRGGLDVNLATLDHVELVFHGIEVVELDPEESSTDEGQDGDDSVVPDQERVLGEGDEGKADGRREGVHEEADGLDHGAHVCGSLGVSVLERRDRGEDLRQGNEHIRTGLGPDGEVNDLVASAGVLAAGALLVDVVLENGGPDHGATGNNVTGTDALQGSEVDFHLPQARVDELVHDGNEDDEREGVKVGQHIVGDTTQLHGSSLRDQVVVELVIAEPVKRVPHEHSAGLEATANFVNPCYTN